VPQNAANGAVGDEARLAPTKQQIFRSALELFALQGYEATSARQLAARVGIEAGSLYNHISSKQDLLFQLIQKATYDLIVTVSREIDAAGEDPVERLAGGVRAHVIFYCVNSTQALVGDRELRALTPENFAETRKQRDEYEALFIGILEQGIRRGLFRTLDSHTICFGILGLSNVALWYRPGGRLAAAEIADSYADFVMRAVLAPTAQRRWVRRREGQSG
jgi:AcrR family transcriptional regulator